MRTVNVILVVVGVATLVVAGVICLAAGFYPPVLLTLGDTLSGPVTYSVEGVWGRAFVLALGAALLLFVAYTLWWNVQASRRERTVVLQNPMGEVMVSLPAIEDFDRILRGKIEGLKDIRGRVVDTRRGLRVSARITVLSDYSIAEVTQKVQNAIRHYVQETLGIDQDINPAVIVTKVVKGERPLAPSPMPATARKPAAAETDAAPPNPEAKG